MTKEEFLAIHKKYNIPEDEATSAWKFVELFCVPTGPENLNPESVERACMFTAIDMGFYEPTPEEKEAYEEASKLMDELIEQALLDERRTIIH